MTGKRPILVNASIVWITAGVSAPLAAQWSVLMHLSLYFHQDPQQGMLTLTLLWEMGFTPQPQKYAPGYGNLLRRRPFPDLFQICRSARDEGQEAPKPYQPSNEGTFVSIAYLLTLRFPDATGTRLYARGWL